MRRFIDMTQKFSPAETVDGIPEAVRVKNWNTSAERERRIL